MINQLVDHFVGVFDDAYNAAVMNALLETYTLKCIIAPLTGLFGP